MVEAKEKRSAFAQQNSLVADLQKRTQTIKQEGAKQLEQHKAWEE